jgi:hypothetical protein
MSVADQAEAMYAPVDTFLRMAETPPAQVGHVSRSGTVRSWRIDAESRARTEVFPMSGSPRARYPRRTPPVPDTASAVADFLARGGTITRCPTRYAEPSTGAL